MKLSLFLHLFLFVEELKPGTKIFSIYIFSIIWGPAFDSRAPTNDGFLPKGQNEIWLGARVQQEPGPYGMAYL